MAELGFHAPFPEDGKVPDKHLETATCQTNGFSNSVELHYNLFNSFSPLSMTFETTQAKALVFECAGVSVSALGPEDMLLHLCEHIAYHASIWEPIRLIWIVDVIGFAEKFVDQMDWEYLRKQHPIVLNLLSLFHCVCPLSATLQAREARSKLALYLRGLGKSSRDGRAIHGPN